MILSFLFFRSQLLYISGRFIASHNDIHSSSLEIDIDEGEVAEIVSINIVGNTSFDDEEILKDFELKTGGWFSFFTNDNRYSREKLKGDIESLESYYKNRGYVEFRLDSSQVSITPDKTSVFITLNVDCLLYTSPSPRD